MEVISPPAEPTLPPASSPLLLRRIARAAFHRLAVEDAALCQEADAGQIAERAAEVVAANIASGRFEHAQLYGPQGDGELAMLADYAWRVVRSLLAESERLADLKGGYTAAWSPVIAHLEQAAYRWFGSKERAESQLWEAREIANRTCADMWSWLQANPFPFDVPFDRWALKWLNNRLHEAARQQRTYERHVVGSLDDPVAGPYGDATRAELLPDKAGPSRLERIGDLELLKQAIDTLEELQAEVVRLWYLEQWAADEIAACLGVQVSYVYVLRFRAIQALRMRVLPA